MELAREDGLLLPIQEIAAGDLSMLEDPQCGRRGRGGSPQKGWTVGRFRRRAARTVALAGLWVLSWSVLVGASHAFPKKDSAAAPLAARQARQARGRGDPLRRSIRALQHPHALPAVRCGLPRAAHTAHFCYAAPCSLARHHPDASADIYKHSQGLDGPGRLRAARRSFLGVPGSPFCSLALGREQQRGPASGFAARAV